MVQQKTDRQYLLQKVDFHGGHIQVMQLCSEIFFQSHISQQATGAFASGNAEHFVCSQLVITTPQQERTLQASTLT
jgi:hypothetical protein